MDTQPTQNVRRVFTAEQRAGLLERFRQSGLTQDAFVAQAGISKASLGKWLQKERAQARARLAQPKFQEIGFAKAGSQWALELVSPQNWTVRLSAVPQGEALTRVLRSLPC